MHSTIACFLHKVFKNQIDRNMEVYVDDILIKNDEVSLYIDDLTEAFNTLRSYQMRLNPTKCAFGVTSKKFLSNFGPSIGGLGLVF